MIRTLPNSKSLFSFFFLLLLLLLNIFIASAQHSVGTLCGTGIQGNPLSGPGGICISPDGNTLYLCDYAAHKIKKITISSGAVTTLAGTGTAGYQDGALLSAKFYFPTGIKTSSDGNFLYIADNGNCLIRKIDIAGGQVSTIAGVYNAFSYADNANGMLAQFNQPVDIINSGDSVLYISDSENYIIRKLNLTTTQVTTLAGTPAVAGNVNGTGMNAKFKYPMGLCLSSNGQKLYVADASNHEIRTVRLSDQLVSTLAGTGYQGNSDNVVGMMASFYSPQGVVALPNDSLIYVIDTYNSLIRTVNVNTTAVSTVAGSAVTAQNHFADNSDGMLAKFYHPYNAVLSLNSQKLYIADQENYRVRTMNTDVITTSIEQGYAINSLSISLYPNPASGYTNLAFDMRHSADVEYSVLNIKGEVVIPGKHLSNVENQTLRLPLNNLADGMYYIAVQAVHEKFYLSLMLLN